MTINAGAATISNATALNTLNLGTITRAGANGGTVNFILTGAALTTTQAGNNDILGGFAVVANGANWAVGSATQGTSGSVTAYAAYTSSVAGTASYAAANNIDFLQTNTANWTTQTVNSLRFNVATASTLTITAANTLTLGSGGILVTPTNAAAAQVITGGPITAGTNDLIINQWATTGALSINSFITGTGGLTKSGTVTANNGIAVIGGNAAGALGTIANTFSGNVFLDAGTLQVNVSSATNGNTATATTGALGGTQNAVNIYGASTANNATVLSIKADNSTGSSTPGNIAVGNNVTVNGAFTAINVGSLGGGGGTVGSGIFLAPVNQTVQLGTLGFVNDGNTLTVTPSNGYGLEFTGTTTFNKNFTTVSVGTAAASNVVQGLTLSGQVTGTAPGGVAFTKTGAGTLVLNSASNDFVGSIVVGTGTNTASFGVVAFNSDAALGNAANTITLNGGGGTGTATIRAYGGGSISTSRTAAMEAAAATL